MATIIAAAAIGGAMGGGAAHFIKADEMKKQDLEIAVEREMEKYRMEAEERKREPIKGLKHFTHPHTLEEVNLPGDEFTCGSCSRSGRGRRYRCETEGCGFEMHRVCASSPVMLVGDFRPDLGEAEEVVGVGQMKTFAHKEHVMKEVYKHEEKYDCGHCNNIGKGMRFHCDECEFDLHPICAKSPTQITSFMHPEHDLALMTRPLLANCTICGHGSKRNNRVYACEDCEFYLHPTCSVWPQYLFHELHPVPHPLQFEMLSSRSESQSKCSACKKKCKRSRYHCRNCDESFHPVCLLRFSLSGSADGKFDKFRKEVMKHSAFHVGFLGLFKGMALVL